MKKHMKSVIVIATVLTGILCWVLSPVSITAAREIWTGMIRGQPPPPPQVTGGWYRVEQWRPGYEPSPPPPADIVPPLPPVIEVTYEDYIPEAPLKTNEVAWTLRGDPGSTEGGATIKIYGTLYRAMEGVVDPDPVAEDVLLASFAAEADGSWRRTIYLDDYEGTVVEIKVSATDAAGNESDRSLYGSFLYDATPPRVEIYTEPVGLEDNFTEEFIVIEGKIHIQPWERYADIQAWIEGIPLDIDDITGEFSDSVELVIGTNYIDVRARDLFGNDAAEGVLITRVEPLPVEPPVIEIPPPELPIPPPPPLISTTIVISPPSFDIPAGGSRTIQAILLDETYAPLADKTIEWRATPGSVDTPITTTGSQGQATVIYTAPVADIQTSVTILAIFRGDNEYGSSIATSFGTVIPSRVAESAAENMENVMERLGFSIQEIAERVSRIENAILEGRVGVCLSIEMENGVTKTETEFEHEKVTIEVKEVRAGEEIELEVSSEVKSGRTVVLNLDDETWPDPGDLRVLYENEPIGKADDYEDALDPTDDENKAEYLILIGDEGIQILVSIPSFTTRTIVIATLPTAPVLAVPLYVIGVCVVALLIVLVTIVWWYLRAERKKLEKHSGPLRGR